MADVLTGKTEVDAVSMEMIASIIQDELIQRSILLPTVLDFSAMVGPGMDKLKIPRAGSFTAEAKAENTALNAQALTMATDDLALDKHYAVQALIEDFAKIQSQPDVLRIYLERFASALAYQVDVDLYSQLSSPSTSSPDHQIDWANAPTDTVTKADFLAAMKLLKIQNAPQDGNFFALINPKRESEVLALSDFVDADKWVSGSESAKLNGVIGRVYGFNVLVSNIVSDDDCIFYHKSAVAFARQLMPRVQSQYQLEHLADRVSMDHVYGVKVLQSGKLQVAIGAA